tara:strand:+ start:89 stop:211 length:123 start_codon:yes stop_codon:yes gene_type:complete
MLVIPSMLGSLPHSKVIKTIEYAKNEILLAIPNSLLYWKN